LGSTSKNFTKFFNSADANPDRIPTMRLEIITKALNSILAERKINNFLPIIFKLILKYLKRRSIIQQSVMEYINIELI
jgi:predicted nucleic acid-binding OB-fold protein